MPTVITTEGSDPRQMQTPILQSRKFSTFGSTRKILAQSFVQTEKKPNRPTNDDHQPTDAQDDEGLPDPSELDRNNMIDQSSCAKKSTGLKCIAKQVIDIMRTRAYMSYPQVAAIVVNMRLKNSLGSPKFSDGLCSQSNLLENDYSCWGDESNLATSAKKKKRGMTAVGGGDPVENETPAKRRSRQESNLRRRIYDAWNVLKAASIIVEYDDMHYRYNPSILREQDGSKGDPLCENDLIQERIRSSNIKATNNLSLQSSGS